MSIVRVVRDLATGDALITFDYDPDVINLIKSINHKSRTCNPENKIWTIRSQAVDDVIWMLQQAGHRVLTTVTGKAATRGMWADQLFAAVGCDRTDAVHRALTKILHPDTPTGDGELQQQLNDARARVSDQETTR